MNNEITFTIIDPQAKPGEWESKEDPSPYVHLSKDGFAKSLKKMVNQGEVVIHKNKINVLFDYPLDEGYVITLYPPLGGYSFTRAGLARAISEKYQKIYREEEESTTIIPETYGERKLRQTGKSGYMLNRVTTNGSWGIWGHVISDLALHSVTYNEGEGLYTLGIDS